MTDLIAWSYSRIQNRETCPRKYYHQNVAKDVKETKSDETLYGEQVHQSFKMYLQTGAELPLHLRQYQPYLDRFKSAPGHKITEQQIALDQNFKQVEWYDRSVYLRVISDLTIHHGNKAVVLDWKTGKPKDDFTQLELLSAVVFLLGPEIESIVMAFFWTKTKHVTSRKITRAEVPGVWERLQPRIQAFQDAYAANHWPPIKNYLCKGYCPVTSCEFWEPKRR